MAKQTNVPVRTTTMHDLPGDLLELTLLRISSTTGIIRAAATCKLWRRMIGDTGFLRRFRHRNAPHILGHHRYYCEDGRTDFFPFPAPAEGEIAAIDVGDRVFLHFFPRSYSSPMHLELHDSRRGLLAFYRMGFSIIICCPWTKQHRELNPTKPSGNTHTDLLGIFLLDADPDETGPGLTMSNFRVLCARLIPCCSENSKIVDASVFSARDNRWHQLGITAVDDIVPEEIVPGQLVLLGRAGGLICWYSKSTNVVLHLDEITGEFSRFTLPDWHTGIDCYNRWNFRVIGGDTSSVYLVRISGDDLELLCYDRRFGACVVERKVRASQLDSVNDEVIDQYQRRWYFSEVSTEAAAPGCIVQCNRQCDVEYVWRFSADTRNIELERVQKFNRYGGQAFPYELPWTISVCL